MVTTSMTREFLGGSFVLAMFLLGLILHVALAWGVRRDAIRIRRSGRATEFIGPTLWTLEVLLGGLTPMAVYWLIHHSTLRADEAGKSWRTEEF